MEKLTNLQSFTNTAAKSRVRMLIKKASKSNKGMLIYVQGAVAQGKSHLLEGVQRELSKSLPVTYLLPFSTFPKEVSGIMERRAKLGRRFKEVLIIDGLDLLVHPYPQHTPNTLINVRTAITSIVSDGGLVFCSGRVPPKEVDGLSSDLKVLFEKAEIVEIKRLSDENARKFVRSQLGSGLSNRVVNKLVKMAINNPRELQSVSLYFKIVNSSLKHVGLNINVDRSIRLKQV